MKAVLIILILVALLGGGGFYAYRVYGEVAPEPAAAIAFIDAYGAYKEVAVEVERLTYVPGTEENKSRAELERLLTTMLTGDVEPSAREADARRAFEHVDALKKNIDAAQAAQNKLYGTIDDLRAAAEAFKSKRLKEEALRIASDARAGAELSARITSALAETNEQTYAIVTRILDERGELSDMHKADINTATVAAETRFAELEKLYAELTANRTALESAFSTFAPSALK